MTSLRPSLYAAALPLVLFPCAALAQSVSFDWEGELELGNESVLSSDVPADEISDTYGNLTLSGALGFGNGLTAFATLKSESMTDPTGDRVFGDQGLYIEELGLQYETDTLALTFGKFHPVFGMAWDVAAGFYGGTLAEDYELTEQIGIGADLDLDGAGVLSFALFYADDTALSRSAGFDRGRNTTAAGGAGNTGRLDNVALSWTRGWGDTSVQIGARHLSAGTGDVGDETGLIGSVGHVFGDSLGLFAEVAAFDNYGGSADDATYATLNGVYYVGNWSLSATLARRDVDSAGVTDLASVAAEYEFENGLLLGAALARVDDAGTRSTSLGVNMIVPLGG